MSTTNFATTSQGALKVWGRATYSDAVKETIYGRLTGTSDRSIIQVKDELTKSEGDRIRFGLRMLPTGIGVQDDETLEGNEEGLDFTYFDLNLGEKRHAVKVDLNLSEQRSMFNVQSEAKAALTEWCAEYLDTTTIEYLTGMGQGPGGASRYHPSGPLGGNAIQPYAANRIVRGGTATSTANTTAADTMSLRVIDRLIDMAKLASPTMRKANFGGKSCYVCILHPYQISAIRTNTSAGQWLDIQKALTQGGGKGLLFDDGVGMYRDVLFIESTRIPLFMGGAGNSVPMARGVFLGAQALAVATGRKGKAGEWGKLALAEKTFDYGKRYGIAATFIFGLRRTQFDGQSDFASFAIDTAAAPLT